MCRHSFASKDDSKAAVIQTGTHDLHGQSADRTFSRPQHVFRLRRVLVYPYAPVGRQRPLNRPLRARVFEAQRLGEKSTAEQGKKPCKL